MLDLNYISPHSVFQSATFIHRRRDRKLVGAIIEKARSHRSLSDSQLLKASEDIRARIARDGLDAQYGLVDGFALVYEALRRNVGVELYEVQILAALTLAQGCIAEMQTGEGKTFSCAPAAYIRALNGRGVHVVTPNPYLARRDFELLQSTFESLGVTAGLLPEQAAPAEKRRAYLCDITYGTGYEFGFDYLRDQLTKKQVSNRTLGSTLLGHIQSSGDAEQAAIQRGLAFAIVDEIDDVLLDDASSPLVLSGTPAGDAEDGDAHRMARHLITELLPEKHYRVDASSSKISLTRNGIERIHAPDVPVPVEQLRRTWTEYVEQALRAEMLLRRDVHYVVSDETIQIVDASTGRIFTDRTWRDGLHQAIEAKENVHITAEKQSLAQITRQRHFRLYEGLCGMTGTATGCEREFRQVYGLEVVPIPLRVDTERRLLPMRLFANAEAKWQAIAESVEEVHRSGRPILVGTRSIEDSELLALLLDNVRLRFQLLNGRQDEEEADVVGRAGESGAITIATNLAGRGTDIKLGNGVRDRGGLHVVVADCHESVRVDRQLIGRCGRQGDPGSAQSFVSAEDSLIQTHAPWLAKSMQRYANQQGEITTDLTTHIRRIQRSAEQQQYAVRSNLLRRDMSRDSLMSRLGGEM